MLHSLFLNPTKLVPNLLLFLHHTVKGSLVVIFQDILYECWFRKICVDIFANTITRKLCITYFSNSDFYHTLFI